MFPSKVLVAWTDLINIGAEGEKLKLPFTATELLLSVVALLLKTEVVEEQLVAFVTVISVLTLLAFEERLSCVVGTKEADDTYMPNTREPKMTVAIAMSRRGIIYNSLTPI